MFYVDWAAARAKSCKARSNICKSFTNLLLPGQMLKEDLHAENIRIIRLHQFPLLAASKL